MKTSELTALAVYDEFIVKTTDSMGESGATLKELEQVVEKSIRDTKEVSPAVKLIPDSVENGIVTCEQHARDILERMGIDGAQNFSASSLVEIANLISQSGRPCTHCGKKP